MLLGEGLGTSGIAARLSISRETARNHIQAVMSALGVHSRLEAVAVAHRLGLLPPRS
jgi:DNA-binding NarL/FixJ family response regulator